MLDKALSVCFLISRELISSTKSANPPVFARLKIHAIIAVSKTARGFEKTREHRFGSIRNETTFLGNL